MYFVFKPYSQSHGLLPDKEGNQASFYNVKFSFSYAEIIKKCIALIFPFPFRNGNGPEKAP